ncbi:MAG: T9SS type A sorting domain-containing protein [Chitinophagales bacterium]|nr:T9SS type A sorting domain-containing protein [Chitinophagales bacterium]
MSADLNNLSSGVYLVRFSTNEEVITKKIVVVK